MKQIGFYIAALWMVVSSLCDVSHAQTNIVSGEYFYDSDPGYGNGNAITINTPASNISSLLVNANTSNISNGMHTLFIRTKDANGKWSMTNSLVFAKYQPVQGNPNALTNINKMEYFYDTDPGYGNGTNIPVTASTNINSMLVNVNVASLSGGFHTLYIRSRDSMGKWSMTNSLVFAKYQPVQGNPNSISNINKMEYFYDTDPGYGNGTNIPVTASTNINGMLVNVNVASLSGGFHTLYIRSRDSLGKWSMTNSLVFAKYQPVQGNPNSISNINKMEYFYDTDPGYGNGTNIPVTASTNINGMLVNVNVASLTGGLHTLYIRSRDSMGKWSMTNSLTFSRIQLPLGNPNSITNINKMEYYYDSDPGFGNGINIPVTPATNLNNMVVNVNVATLANGVHTLYIRSRDSVGKWSQTNSLTFAKVQPLFPNPDSISNITQVEYFVDTDPGFGNATSVPLIPPYSSNLMNLSFNVSMTSLNNGAHVLYVRSKDASGKWSITNIHPFNGGTLPPLSIKLITFDASLQQDNTVLLKWMVENEKDVSHYRIERSMDAGNWVFVGNQKQSANNNSRNEYQMIDDNPGKGIVYYRLTAIETSGNQTMAPIRFVKIGTNESDVATVYPNPNDGKLINIYATMFKQANVTIDIITTDGKLYWSQTVNTKGNTNLTLSNLNLPAATYYINMRSQNETQSIKLQVIPKER